MIQPESNVFLVNLIAYAQCSKIITSHRGCLHLQTQSTIWLAGFLTLKNENLLNWLYRPNLKPMIGDERLISNINELFTVYP